MPKEGWVMKFCLLIRELCENSVKVNGRLLCRMTRIPFKELKECPLERKGGNIDKPKDD